MQKIFFLVIVLYFHALHSFSQSIDSVVISRCLYVSYPDSTRLIEVDSFDVNGLLSSNYMYDSNWVPIWRSIYIYSLSNLLVTVTGETYDTSGWVVGEELFNYYDLNDSLKDTYHFQYPAQGTDTVGTRNIYDRNVVDHSLTKISFDYVDSSNTWDTLSASIFYFDSLNKTIRRINEHIGPSGYLTVSDSSHYVYLANDSIDYREDYLFTYIDRYQNIYNADGYLLQVVDSAWNYQTQDWDELWLMQYYRDTSNNILARTWHLYLDTLGTLFPCGDSLAFQYNITNQEIASSASYCGGGGSYGSRTYYPDGSLLHMQRCGWGHGGPTICTECDYEYYTYPFTTVAPVILNSPPVFSLSPNPFNSTLYLTFSKAQAEKAHLRIFDSKGNVIFKKEIILIDQKINLEYLPEGIYFVKVITPQSVFTSKIIKQ